MIDAIGSDKDFASELTRVEFDAVRPGEEVIPVEMALKLDARAFQSTVSGPAFQPKWYEPVVQWLANDAPVRTALSHNGGSTGRCLVYDASASGCQTSFLRRSRL